MGSNIDWTCGDRTKELEEMSTKTSKTEMQGEQRMKKLEEHS